MFSHLMTFQEMIELMKGSDGHIMVQLFDITLTKCILNPRFPYIGHKKHCLEEKYHAKDKKQIYHGMT